MTLSGRDLLLMGQIFSADYGNINKTVSHEFAHVLRVKRDAG